MAEAVRRRSLAGSVLGVVIGVIGLVLAVGGAWLAGLGGSWYYVITGVLMVVSGVLLFRGRRIGACGPMMEVLGLMKITGSSGGAAPISAACAA